MLASRARDSPCSARDWRLSSLRSTVATPSSTAMETRSWKRRFSSPLGPLTVTSEPSTLMSTPEGTSIGFFPTRLISPNLTHDFAPEPAPARFAIRQESLGGGYDHHAQATLDPGDVGGPAIDPVAGLGHPAQALDDGLVTVDVAKLDREGLARPGLGHVVTVDEAFLGEDAGDRLLELRRGHRHVVVTNGHGVADAGEHVGDGIGHHDYHDAFLTPGSSPREASSRTQRRHIPKSRR